MAKKIKEETNLLWAWLRPFPLVRVQAAKPRGIRVGNGL